MKAYATSSAASTAAMSASGPANPRTQAARPARLSESEYLQKQAADARAAMGATLRDLEHAVLGTMDVAAWTREYPFIATGTAMAAGFLATIVVVPQKSDDSNVKTGRFSWEKIKSVWSAAMHRENGKETSADPASATAPSASTAAPASEWAWLGTLLHEIYMFLRPVVIGLISAAMSRPRVPQSDGQDTV